MDHLCAELAEKEARLQDQRDKLQLAHEQQRERELRLEALANDVQRLANMNGTNKPYCSLAIKGTFSTFTSVTHALFVSSALPPPGLKELVCLNESSLRVICAR